MLSDNEIDDIHCTLLTPTLPFGQGRAQCIGPFTHWISIYVNTAVRARNTKHDMKFPWTQS